MADQNALTASYTSPSNPSFSISLPLPSDPADKTAFLASLRAALTTAQASINQELTSRMEDDKAALAAAPDGIASASLAADEDKEEQNYGEEAQEEED